MGWNETIDDMIFDLVYKDDEYNEDEIETLYETINYMMIII